MIYNFAKQQILFITSITKNLIGTVLDGRVTTSQFPPVGTNEELATIGRLYD